MDVLDSPLPYLGALFLAKLAVFYYLRNKKPSNAKYIGHISRLSLFPVKSMRGIEYDHLACTNTGHVDTANGLHDRTWLVTTDDYIFITARQKPVLVTIETSVQGNDLHLDLHGRSTLKLPLKESGRKVIISKVWGEKIEVYDCGEESAAWISSVLGESCRIVHHAPGLQNRNCMGSKSSFHKLAKADDQITFHDQFPYHLLSEASLSELNSRLEKPVTIDHFRPNMVISGCAAFAEDKVKQVFIGDARMTNIKPCNRCLFTTVDPSLGVMNDEVEPLRTLRSYRCLVEEFGNSPCFGINLVVDRPGRITVGDAVYATT